MDTSDSKRRRVDISPPPASRGTDRYVPDRSKTSRMDVDSPRPRQEICSLFHVWIGGSFLTT